MITSVIKKSFGKILTLVVVSFVLVACGTEEPEVQVELPAEELYDIALQFQANGAYEEAIKAFEEVERQHPKHPLAKQAIADIVLLAYSNLRYLEVVSYADTFLTFNPQHELAPKIAYVKAQSYYEQIVDVGRDQGNTAKALESLTDVILKYPDSVFALSARNKIELAKDHIAGKHLDVGRFYLFENAYQPAIARFAVVIEEYSYTSQVPEALARTVEAYLALGLYDRAYETGLFWGITTQTVLGTHMLLIY